MSVRMSLRLAAVAIALISVVASDEPAQLAEVEGVLHLSAGELNGVRGRIWINGTLAVTHGTVAQAELGSFHHFVSFSLSLSRRPFDKLACSPYSGWTECVQDVSENEERHCIGTIRDSATGRRSGSA